MTAALTHAQALADAAIERRGGPATVVQAADPLAGLLRFEVTQEQVDSLALTRLIWRELIAAGHVAVWSAPANGGKSTLARYAAGELSRAGWRVVFFQEDAGAGDIPALFGHAREHGYRLLNSTLKDGSTEDQIRELTRTLREGQSLERVVMFFDTLKKYTDLMSKGGARAFFKIMRGLTQRGATVVLLGHTNKHRSHDGKLMFEGVGDVRNDVDELLYIEATDKDADGVVTLTMRPDKVRAAIREATFRLDTTTMHVTPLDHVVDVGAIERARRQREQDKRAIEAIRAALAAGGMNFTTLREQVAATVNVGKHAAAQIIERYMSADTSDLGALWIETRMRASNARHVSLRPGEPAS